MQEVTLDLEKREVAGKAVKQLRRQGMVPAVIHDHGKDSISVVIPYQVMHKAYLSAGKHHPIEVKADGRTFTTLIKHITFDPKYNAISHVVFNAVKANQKVEAEVPIHIRLDEGNEVTPAERNSLIVLRQLESVQVRAVAKDLPDALEFDGEKLIEVGDHATVADLIVPKNVEVEADENQAVATVFEPSALQAANEDAGGDAEESDEAADVEAEHGDKSSDEDSQAEEAKPGGKEGFESNEDHKNES